MGVSLDGYESLHNLYRKDANGHGTFSMVMEGIQALRRNLAVFNALTVVTAQTAKHIKEVYAFLMEQGLTYQRYIACLDPLEGSAGKQRYSLTPKLYAGFLKNLFDVWYQDRMERIFVYNRYFENLAAIVLGYMPESCDMQDTCSVQYAIESDGSVYPCDFYMLDQYRIGHINADSMGQIDRSREETGFRQTSLHLSEKCMRCQWLKIRRGGCLPRMKRLLCGNRRRIGLA